MKPLLLLSIFATLSLSFITTSCQKDDDNGDLYGMWQLMEKSTQKNDSNSITEEQKAKQIYWSFQLKLMNIRATNYTNGVLEQGILAHFKQKGDSLFIENIYQNTRYNDTILSDSKILMLEPAGIINRRTSFKIDHLSAKKLVLSSTYCKLIFRKF